MFGDIANAEGGFGSVGGHGVGDGGCGEAGSAGRARGVGIVRVDAVEDELGRSVEGHLTL